MSRRRVRRNATLAGYLRKQANRDCVFVLLGDHQPAAAVTGEGASWSVPVHVVTSRAEILDALVARSFQRGLTPTRPALGPMHALLPMLLIGALLITLIRPWVSKAWQREIEEEIGEEHAPETPLEETP